MIQNRNVIYAPRGPFLGRWSYTPVASDRDFEVTRGGTDLTPVIYVRLRPERRGAFLAARKRDVLAAARRRLTLAVKGLL